MYIKIHESLENSAKIIERDVSESFATGKYSRIINLHNIISDLFSTVCAVKNTLLYSKDAKGITRKMDDDVIFLVNNTSKFHKLLSQIYNKLYKQKITPKHTIVIERDKCLSTLEKLEAYIKPHFNKSIQAQKEVKIKETLQSWDNKLHENLELFYDKLKNKKAKLPNLIDYIDLAIKSYPQKLAKAKTEWARVLFDLCYNYALNQFKTHPENAVVYFNKALQILQAPNLLEFNKTKLEEEKFDVLFNLELANSIAKNQNCFTKAISCFEKSTHLKNLDDPYIYSMYVVAATYTEKRSGKNNLSLMIQALEKMFALLNQKDSKNKITNDVIVDSFEILILASIKYDPEKEKQLYAKILEITDKLIALILSRQIKPQLLVGKIVQKGHKMFAATTGFVPLGAIFTEMLMKKAKFNNFYACEILFKQPFRGFRNSFVNHPLLGNKPIAFNRANNRLYMIHDGSLVKINPSNRGEEWMYGLEKSADGFKHEPINVFYLVIKHFSLQELKNIKHIFTKTNSRAQIIEMMSQQPNPYDSILTEEKRKFLQNECNIVPRIPRLHIQKSITPKDSPTSTTSDIILRQIAQPGNPPTRKRSKNPLQLQYPRELLKNKKRKIEKVKTTNSMPGEKTNPSLPSIKEIFPMYFLPINYTILNHVTMYQFSPQGFFTSNQIQPKHVGYVKII